MKLELILFGLGICLTVFCFNADSILFARVALPIAFMFLLVVHTCAAPYRWQMAPFWLALLVGQTVLVLSVEPRTLSWFALMAVSSLGVAISLILIAGMPLVRLPRPDGPYTVGTITHTLADPSRPSFESSSIDGRRLNVKVWYPSEPGAAGIRDKPESVWPELFELEDVPKSLKWLTAYLKGARANAVPKAVFSDAIRHPRLVVYNHGMVSIASENSILLEHLASHGLVVFAIRHLDQLQEFQALNNLVSKSQRDENRALTKRLTEVRIRKDRAELSHAYFLSSTATNRIVHGRALDTKFVIDNTASLMAQIPGVSDVRLNTNAVGLLGLSLGGAVATEFSKFDERGAAIVNLDGGIFGTLTQMPVRTPYLMVYSAQNEGSNDAFLMSLGQNHREIVLPDTKHLDLHDAAIVLPILRWMRTLGTASAREVIATKNEATRKHFESFLSNESVDSN